jgi:hypothetical protein
VITQTPLAMRTELVEADNKFWLDITIGKLKLPRKGPFANAQAAKIATEKLIRELTPNVPATTNDDFVVLHGKMVALTSDEGRKFVTDCTRAGEGIITDNDIIDEFEISIEEWEVIKTNSKLGRKIREEGRRRVANGQRAREAAQQHFVKSPQILDKIQSDERASPRYRVDSIRELRAISRDGEESPAGQAKLFSIVFNLGTDCVERIEKVIEPRPKQIEGEVDVEQ